MTLAENTIKAHQLAHGTGRVSDMILAARIAGGWSEKEIAANQKFGIGLVGADDTDDEEGLIAKRQADHFAAKMSRINADRF